MLALALFASVATDAERDILNMSDEEIDYLAFVAMQRGLLNDAQAAFQEVLRRDDQDAFAHAWLGHLAVRSNDLSAAESEYRHAISKISARMEAADAADEPGDADARGDVLPVFILWFCVSFLCFSFVVSCVSPVFVFL